MKKNILLWSYGIDLPLCISYYIQKKIDANIFIILDVTNKPKKFFKEQEIIKFTKMWFYHENIKHHYKKETLSRICAESYSYRQCLDKMGIVPAGGNYACLKRHIQLHGIDISHFTLQGWSKGKIIGPKRPLEDYLTNKISIQSWKLKKRLIKEKVMDHRCNK